MYALSAPPALIFTQLHHRELPCEISLQLLQQLCKKNWGLYVSQGHFRNDITRCTYRIFMVRDSLFSAIDNNSITRVNNIFVYALCSVNVK